MNTTASATLHLPADDGNPPRGTICAANEARFTAAHYSEPLTAFTVGWRDPIDLAGLLEFIAPSVPVGRRFEFKKAENAEAFLSEADDVRAIGAAFKRVEYAGTSVNEKTVNKGLTIRVDHDDVAGDDWQERYTQLLMQRLLRNELRRAITALDNAATASNKTWDNAANPDRDLRVALTSAADDSGVRPNRILFGEGAWNLRAEAYDAQDIAGAVRLAGLSPDELAPKLMVEGVRVAGARYQDAAESKATIVGDNVFLYYGQSGLTKDEPSNLKRFVTPAEGGGSFRVYLEEHSKFTDLSVEHYSTIVATSDVGVAKLAIS